MSDLLDLPLTTLDGEPTTLGALTAGRAALVVNVASRCGLTPQYAGARGAARGVRRPGLHRASACPCNQFMGQEPGTAEEIAEFCSATYGVTFPMTEKVEVNGAGRAPALPAADRGPRRRRATAGDVQWNFEKFLLDRRGEVVARFRPKTAARRPGGPRRDRGSAASLIRENRTPGRPAAARLLRPGPRLPRGFLSTALFDAGLERRVMRTRGHQGADHHEFV